MGLAAALKARRAGPGPLARLRGRFARPPAPWLLLSWDVAGMQAAVMQPGTEPVRLAAASSREGRFAAALTEILAALEAQGAGKVKRVALAARHVLPAVVDLPVAPDRPRPPEQMRELIQADLEPVMAEFGSLWSMGALLQARGHLTPADRERIAMEEAVRRQGRHNQLRYGEIVIDLGLIQREALDECLDQQAALQNLDAAIMAGWRGRLEEGRPLWLACGTGLGVYREWREALARHGLRIEAVLPRTWLASDPAPAAAAGEARREQSVPVIGLEFFPEEVVAIWRRNGRVAAARSEGRIERRPAADWLTRLIADWAAEPRTRIELHFLDAADESGAEELCDALAVATGHPCVARGAEATERAQWLNLLREAAAPVSQLPRLKEREGHGSRWKDPDVRRLLALAAAAAGLAGVEGWQHYRLHEVRAKMAGLQHQEKERAQASQVEAKINQELAALGKELDEARRKLEPLQEERDRLSRLVAMRADLPDLLYLLARSVGGDAVLEEVHNDGAGGRGAAIQVIAWSPSYPGAQAFASRVVELTRAKGYGVSQTEVRERRGRDERAGHEVKFWLLPEQEEAPPANGGGQ